MFFKLSQEVIGIIENDRDEINKTKLDLAMFLIGL